MSQPEPDRPSQDLPPGAPLTPGPVLRPGEAQPGAGRGGGSDQAPADPDPANTPGLEPGGSVQPGDTPPSEAGTQVQPVPDAKEPSRGLNFGIAVGIVALVVLGFLAFFLARLF